MFIQTFILMALLGGVYIPCVIALLPDKTRETYDVFFGLIYDYLNKHNLPNNFSDGFFMTDFEINIRFNDNEHHHRHQHHHWHQYHHHYNQDVLLHVLACDKTFGMLFSFLTTCVEKSKTYYFFLLFSCSFFFAFMSLKSDNSEAKLAREYERNNEFGHLVRMISALPFAPPDLLDDVFILLASKARGIKDPKLKEFSMSLVQYADEQWRQGVFSKQDWKIYDINCLMVPATNNGNEGEKSFVF